LVSVVADNEPAEQRAVIGRQHLSGPFDRASHAVRRPVDETSLVNIAGPIELKLSDDVLPCDSARTFLVGRQTHPADGDPLSSLPCAHTKLLRPPARPHFKSLTVGFDNHSGARRIWLRVINEPNPSGERPQLVGRKPVVSVG